MRILLDESLPIELRDELPGHSVSTVREMGWSSLTNGELLLRAAARFDLFLTADQNLQYQQNLRTLPVAVAVLAARSNRIQDLKPLIAELHGALAALMPRTLVTIGT
jgi:predicted nuclease of predicted toxin-antitoxin system